jgi:cytoskeletal protein CcmA (bactofilin family)
LKYLTKEEFEKRYPRKDEGPEITTIYPGNLIVDQNMVISGIVNGDVLVKSAVQAVVTGVVKGNLLAEGDSVVFLSGAVEGNFKLDGSAFVTGLVKGQVNGSEDACLYVP